MLEASIAVQQTVKVRSSVLQVWRETSLEQAARVTGGVDDVVALDAYDIVWNMPGESVGES